MIDEDYEGPDFTCITFSPDWKRFHMTGMEADTIALLRKVCGSNRKLCFYSMQGECNEYLVVAVRGAVLFLPRVLVYSSVGHLIRKPG